MLSCKEVTRLYASEALGSAPLLRRLKVRFHVLMCTHCKRYVSELRLIGAAARRELGRLLPERSRVQALELAIRERLRAEIRDNEPPPPA